ncbi:two-component sensor histidine kinase, partial [Pelomonas sp. HMWF004]
MSGHRLPSLQARLLAGLVAVALGMGGLMAAVAWRWTGHELEELLDAHLAQAAALLVVQQTGTLAHDDDRVQDAPALHRYAPRAVWQVFHEGQLVLRSSQAPTGPLVPGMAGGFHTVERDGAGWRVFVTHDGGRDLAVLVGERSAVRQEILSAMLGPLLGLGGAALALSLLLSLGVLRWGLAPLRALSQQLAQRRPQQLAPLALPGAPAELAPVLSALNALLARIEALLQGERRLTA